VLNPVSEPRNADYDSLVLVLNPVSEPRNADYDSLEWHCKHTTGLFVEDVLAPLLYDDEEKVGEVIYQREPTLRASGSDRRTHSKGER
jgi:hypothetical protein